MANTSKHKCCATDTDVPGLTAQVLIDAAAKWVAESQWADSVLQCDAIKSETEVVYAGLTPEPDADSIGTGKIRL